MLVLDRLTVEDKAQREKETVYQLLHFCLPNSPCLLKIDVIMKEPRVFHLYVEKNLKTFTITSGYNVFCNKFDDEKMSVCPMEISSDGLLNFKSFQSCFLSPKISHVLAIKGLLELTLTMKISHH